MEKIKFPTTIERNLKLSNFDSNYITKKYVNWLNDKEVVRYSEQRHKHHSMDNCKEYLEKIENSDNYLIAIEIKNDKEWIHIGNIGATYDKNNRSCDLSIMIGNKSQWGNGYGKLAWCVAACKVIEMLGVRIITAGTMSTNIRMLNLFKVCNMKIEAILKKRFIFEGSEVDLVIAIGNQNNFQNAIEEIKKKHVYF